MSIEIQKRIVCDFAISDECVGSAMYCTEAEAIEDYGFERRPGGKHICPECIEVEGKSE